ncbi:MAG: amidohydrolase/deacetylase family metallohydrolase [Streptococcaceae bacterium]|jgi:dihydroorotase|nr:amidohydrolase/deacetylase family metallohydrolase [Streptococcaceae bacterium]
MLDLIIRNAKTMTSAPFEIGVLNGKIVQIAEKIKTHFSKEFTLQSTHYLSAGWIDSHVHCYSELDLYYDYPDEIGVKSGVTTVIDAGSCGYDNIDDFYEKTRANQTNVYALINISRTGIVRQDELSDLENVKEELVRASLEKHPDFIKGLKVRMSKTVIGENGIKPLELAKKIQVNNHQLPLMVHIGSAPANLDEILEKMTEGDILTHCFHGKENGILDRNCGCLKSFVFAGKNKGLIFDTGHGTDSFNFEVATQALDEGLKADTISTDIYIRNRQNGPVYNLATTMEKLHVIGYSWEEIIEKVTSAPAKAFHLTTKGKIAENYDADFTIFEFINEEKELIDSNGNQKITQMQIQPVKTIIGGHIYDALSSKIIA